MNKTVLIVVGVALVAYLLMNNASAATSKILGGGGGGGGNLGGVDNQVIMYREAGTGAIIPLPDRLGVNAAKAWIAQNNKGTNQNGHHEWFNHVNADNIPDGQFWRGADAEKMFRARYIELTSPAFRYILPEINNTQMTDSSTKSVLDIGLGIAGTVGGFVPGAGTAVTAATSLFSKPK